VDASQHLPAPTCALRCALSPEHPQPIPAAVALAPHSTCPEPMSHRSHANVVLLQRARDGDQQAWNELVERYTPVLWASARAYRLPTADAADAVQTTWLRLLEHLHRIEDPTRLAAWLTTTIRRECLRLLRRADREQPHSPEFATHLADPAEPLDTNLIRAERDAALWTAFNRLPDRCRCLLRVLLTDTSPGRYEATAALLDMPVGSIGPTRMRCLNNLRRLLEQADDARRRTPAGTDDRMRSWHDDRPRSDCHGRKPLDRATTLRRRPGRPC
jgi:RNA polymerase sigma factor (sigma-70 family)